MASLTLIRGLPGSGKTTLAKKIKTSIHLEADMYMMQKGKYVFDRAKLGAAHTWCQDTTFIYLSNGYDVVVSNTFTKLKELVPYIEIAEQIGCDLIVYRLNNNYGSIHNIPEETIERMRQRFQAYPGEFVMD